MSKAKVKKRRKESAHMNSSMLRITRPLQLIAGSRVIGLLNPDQEVDICVYLIERNVAVLVTKEDKKRKDKEDTERLDKEG